MINTSWAKAKPVLEKLLQVISKDTNAKASYQSLAYDRNPDDGQPFNKVTIKGMGNANGNRLFTNYPEEFGITKQQAHELREHFQNYQLDENSSDEVKNHFKEVQALIDQYFPPVLEPAQA